ncbi:MAG: sugar transferase [Ignavibacteriae bacterium]|nr:sugar transferase [Ignavibacteriota bacterium]MCB9210067.1 sugar transferase [Ignavibacteriales bacterium]
MYLKNIFDRILAFILLILFLPFLIVFSIILLFELKSFPIYLQERGLTLEKNRFWIYKLKTIKSRDRNIEHKTEEDIFLKTALQDKVKPFSKWLRKTGLDELPQLVNVMMGKMCLIGPRPLMIEDLETMKRISPEIYTRRENLKSLPGISGLWQLFGNRSEGLIGMIALETLYDKVASPLLDLKLLAYTSTVILQAKNSDSIFYVEKSRPTKVHTFIDSSSNLKISLNIPDGIAKFIVENVEKYEGKYTVEIPNNWWYVNNTYKSTKKRFDQISITPQKKDSNKPV